MSFCIKIVNCHEINISFQQILRFQALVLFRLQMKTKIEFFLELEFFFVLLSIYIFKLVSVSHIWCFYQGFFCLFTTCSMHFSCTFTCAPTLMGGRALFTSCSSVLLNLLARDGALHQSSSHLRNYKSLLLL